MDADPNKKLAQTLIHLISHLNQVVMGGGVTSGGGVTGGGEFTGGGGVSG